MKHKLLIGGGLLLLAAALCLTAYNLWDNARAGQAAETVLQEIQERQDLPTETDPDPAAEEGAEEPTQSQQEMPSVTAEGNDYIGVLDIPSLYLSLPILSEWSDSKLRLAPCRYKGSVYENNMIIAGHNYRLHFGSLKNLSVGDTVKFTDMNGVQLSYQVSQMEQLPGTAIQEMEAGDWDLTLFTCTMSGRARLTVRCVSVGT